MRRSFKEAFAPLNALLNAIHPCYFWKLLKDGTRMDFVMYVDDGYVTFSADAQRELDELNAAFKIEIKDAHFFLGNNIDVMARDGAP